MRAVTLALICAFLQTVVAQRTPTISYISQEQIKSIGETVELICSIQYGEDYPVVWSKVNGDSVNEQVDLTIGTALLTRDSRFDIKYDMSLSTYVLQIKDVQETDAGFYQCKIRISANNSINGQTELEVFRSPIISDNSTQSLVVSEGQSIMLECYASGFPLPRISWSRENNAILATGGSIYRGNTLKISAIRKEDQGTYRCFAENNIGRDARRINVKVEFAPVITATSQAATSRDFHVSFWSVVTSFILLQILNDNVKMTDISYSPRTS